MAIADNVRRVRAQIEAAARRAGRDPAAVRLVAVSKTVEVERIRAALAAGIDTLGENYLQEAQAKIRELSPAGASWHFIGHLQSNKAAAAAGLFDLIHSVDRLKLATALETAASRQGKTQDILIEVNLAGEASKSGVAPEGAPELLRAVLACPHLRPRGLMAMPPWLADPEAVRPYFRQLRELRDALARTFPDAFLTELSMGMSQDFEVAIEEGATLVRVGTAIFGLRG